MKAKLFISIFLSAGSFHVATAQSSFGIFAGAGPSWASGKLDPPIEGFDFKIHSIPTSANAGFFYSCALNDKFTFGTKMLFSTSAAKLNYTYADSTEYIHSEGLLSVRSYAVGLAPYIGFNYKKLALNVGIQALYYCALRYDHTYSDSYGGGGGISYQEMEKVSLLSSFAYDLGATVGIDYHLNKRCTAELNYCHGLHNVLNQIDNDQSAIVVKSRQLTVGIKFALWIPKENNTSEQ